MLKQTLAAAALLASVSSVIAQAGDPTSNGLVASAICYVRNVTTCQTAWCEQIATDC